MLGLIILIYLVGLISVTYSLKTNEPIKVKHIPLIMLFAVLGLFGLGMLLWEFISKIWNKFRKYSEKVIW